MSYAKGKNTKKLETGETMPIDESLMDLKVPAVIKTGEGSSDDDSGFHSHDRHGHHNQPPQMWGRGIVSDARNTIGKHWVKEMTNFNTKTIAVSFFLFIAVIAPSITFGAVYAKRTNNNIGAVELLLATAWCGIFYALVSGMPMVRTVLILLHFRNSFILIRRAIR